MRPSRRVAVLLLLATNLFVFHLQAQNSADIPSLTGRVTRIGSPRDFDVNGIHILATRDTSAGLESTRTMVTDQWPAIHLGDTLKVYGKLDKKNHSVAATKIWIVPVPSGDGATVSGTAIVDLLPPPTAVVRPDTLLIRADGYFILLTPRTVLSAPSSLHNPSLSDVHTNTWVTYHGIRRPDGVILADKAYIKPNVIARSENTLLFKTDYDPDKVDPNARQTGISKFVKGTDPKQIPPYVDAAMQARIERVGASLIPAYQRALPDLDLTKIDFRFQLVDKKYRTICLPSGILLVPYDIVEALPDDSHLAAVLAYYMADILEKQRYRFTPASQAITAINIAADVGGYFVPGLGLATFVVTGTTAAKLNREIIEQDSRVSLTLLDDAHYDIREAPRAWWICNTKGTKSLIDTPVPWLSGYLYDVLASTWTGKTANP